MDAAPHGLKLGAGGSLSYRRFLLHFAVVELAGEFVDIADELLLLLLYVWHHHVVEPVPAIVVDFLELLIKEEANPFFAALDRLERRSINAIPAFLAATISSISYRSVAFEGSILIYSVKTLGRKALRHLYDLAVHAVPIAFLSQALS